METLRFISTPSQAKRLNDHLDGGSKIKSIRGLEVEAISLQVIEEICRTVGVDFALIGIDQFLQHIPSDGVSLLLDADVEPIVYSDFWGRQLQVDGAEINKIVSDKFRVYRMIREVPGVSQPKTIPVHNHHDVESALTEIQTDKVVLKPRISGHSSRNVLIVDRTRIEQPRDDERLNFHNCIMQEYPPESLWPPKEWRLHFVGRKLCRCLKITDKNNWKGYFKIEDIPLLEIPIGIGDQALKIAARLVNNRNKDNFTLDFLETKNGPIFLEANCGALGSFYIDDPEKKDFLQEIFITLFRLHFKRRIKPCIS